MPRQMAVLNRLKEWAQRRPVELVFSLITAAFFVAEASDKLTTLKSLFADFLGAGLNVNWKSGQLEVKWWLFGGFFLLVLLTVFFFLLYVRSLGDTERRGRKGLEALEAMIGAADQIRRQFLPNAGAPIHSFLAIRNSYFIYRNFDAAVVREYEVAASGQPLHFYEWTLGVEDYADAADYLADVDFRVQDGSGTNMAYLATKNAARKKAVAVYFLPQIEPGQSRQVMITYRWPRMLRGLALTQNHHELFTWKVESSAKVPEVKLEIFLEDGAGRLSCEKKGSLEGSQTLDRCDYKDAQGKTWAGWRYLIKNAPNAQYALDIKLG